MWFETHKYMPNVFFNSFLKIELLEGYCWYYHQICFSTIFSPFVLNRKKLSKRKNKNHIYIYVCPLTTNGSLSTQKWQACLPQGTIPKHSQAWKNIWRFTLVSLYYRRVHIHGRHIDVNIYEFKHDHSHQFQAKAFPR